jgi:hypothetical protein
VVDTMMASSREQQTDSNLATHPRSARVSYLSSPSVFPAGICVFDDQAAMLISLN